MENKTESSETAHEALLPVSRRFWDSQAAFARCAVCRLRQLGNGIGGIIVLIL